MTPFVILSCMMAAIGGVIFGYAIGISGSVTSMEPFLEKFFPEVNTKMKSDTKISNYCKFDSELLTSFTSSLYIAGLVASLFASLVTRALRPQAFNPCRWSCIPCRLSSKRRSYEPLHAHPRPLIAWSWYWFWKSGCSIVPLGNGTTKIQRSN